MKLPVVSYLLPVCLGDKRSKIVQASQSFVSDAPINIIIVLDIEKTKQWDDLSNERLRWIWYYEAGAAAHNVLLQALPYERNYSISNLFRIFSVTS